jgi:hypothetical protein
MSPSFSSATIFVSIASYRDKTCSLTVKSILQNAEFPERIFIGICEQNHPDTLTEEKCVTWKDPFFLPYYHQIRRIQISFSDAEGPCYARYLCSLLFKNEDYFVQIDAHSLFSKHWDSTCLRILHSLPDPSHSILSYYPVPEDKYEEYPSSSTEIPVIKNWNLNKDGVLQWGAGIYTVLKEPTASPHLAAGFIFAPSSFLQDVPFDPNLSYLFMGEESLLTLRAYTAGYDIYTPNKSIVYHRYLRNDEPNVYVDNAVRSNNKEALKRVKRLTGLLYIDNPCQENEPPTTSIDRYGLGTKRTWRSYLQRIGYIDGFGNTIKKPTVVEDIKESYENQNEKKKKVIEEFSWCKKPKTKVSVVLFVVYVIFIVLVIFILSIFFIFLFPNIKPLLFKKKTL